MTEKKVSGIAEAWETGRPAAETLGKREMHGYPRRRLAEEKRRGEGFPGFLVCVCVCRLACCCEISSTKLRTQSDSVCELRWLCSFRQQFIAGTFSLSCVMPGQKCNGGPRKFSCSNDIPSSVLPSRSSPGRGRCCWLQPVRFRGRMLLQSFGRSRGSVSGGISHPDNRGKPGFGRLVGLLTS